MNWWEHDIVRQRYAASRRAVELPTYAGSVTFSTPEAEIDEIARLVGRGHLAVLTGAGISTESGIPDYRGVTGRARPATPMTYQEFAGSAAARQRYWARSHLGWRRIGQARPNAGHRAVADLERAGLITHVITQNVDGLHQAAGARKVIELHGSLDRVRCLDCGSRTSRVALEARLNLLNDGFGPDAGGVLGIKPDGDLDLLPQPVDCEDCDSGRLKPDVVFFGENVPPARVQASYDVIARSDTLLVLGSSLTVASGFRFVRRAADLKKPIVLVNQGETRGDKYATIRVDAPLGEVLPELVRRVATLEGAGVEMSERAVDQA